MSKIFISYCHKDKNWKDRIVNQLLVPEDDQGKILDVWDDSKIAGGEDWEPKIEQAIHDCSVALLLISADFMNSKFIKGKEIPPLFQRRKNEGLRIIPVIVRDCAWTSVKWLSGIQARPLDGRALSSFTTKGRADKELSSLCQEIISLIDSPLNISHTEATNKRQTAPEEVEQSIVQKAEADFNLYYRESQHAPQPEDLTKELTKIREGSYAPFHVMNKSVTARIDHDLLPMVKKLIQIESDLRSTYQVVFTEGRIDDLRQKIRVLVEEELPHIISAAHRDAERHVIIHTGNLPDYKNTELCKLDERMNNTNFAVLFSVIDDLLQSAKADSILSTRSKSA